MIKRVVFIALFFAIQLIVKAQNPVNLKSNQEFWHLTPQQGLSQSNVTAIFQDSEGFMWFGTQEGLNKFEGQNGRIAIYKHKPDDTTSIGSNEIEDILEDSRGNLWIATDWGGLNLYDREKDHFIRYNATEELHSGNISDDAVHTLYEDKRGNFWIGTYQGLNLMDREKNVFRNFVTDSEDPLSISNNYVTDVYEDNKGQLWVGTRNGLNRLNRDSFTFDRFYIKNQSQFHSENYVQSLYEDSKGILWVGTESGLYMFNTNTETFKIWNSKISATVTILDIFEDHSGIIWVGTENEGLLAITPDHENSILIKYSENSLQGLNSNSIYSLYEGKNKILWVGTHDGGLNILNRKANKFRHFKNIPGDQNSLNENSIYIFLKPEGDDIWIGTDGGGINIFNPETESFRFLRRDPENKNSLSNDVVFDMIQDQKGNIWIGTYNGGLVRYNPKTEQFNTYRYDADDPNSLGHDQIFVVFEDSKGVIWAGTNGNGLSKLIDEDRGIFESWNSNNQSHYFPQNYIRDIYEDENGFFWVTSYGGGISIFNPETGESKDYTAGDGTISNGVVSDIYVADNKTIWVGTKGGGLARYNAENDRFDSYTTEDGLPNDIVNAILEDDHGNIWASTNYGITRFSPEEETFKNYTISDGLQSLEFKPRASLKDENGVMYFGGINGFNQFHPDSIREDSLVAPVAFTDFQLSNRSVSIGENSPLKKHINQAEEIILPYNKTNIVIKYSVLNFDPRQEYSYAYLLEGFDLDWNYVDAQNSATYTNLDPGEYTFKLKTANSDGYWGNIEKQVRIVITPPFWQTTWFYMLSGLAFISIIIGGFKYRTRQITQQNKRLEKKVNDRTQELMESNNDLKKALSDLKETRKELVLNAHKAGMADIAAGVVHNIGNVLNSINTSTTLTGEVLKKSKFSGLKKVNQLLIEHKDDLVDFLTNDIKGQKLLDYLKKLEDSVSDDLKILENHNHRMEKKVQLINDVIAAQQSYANVGLGDNEEDLNQILEDTLTIFSVSLDRHNIKIEKEFDTLPFVSVQKTKLVHVILNVLKNAKDAMIEAGVEKRIIKIETWQDGQQVHLRISDNGTGIRNKHLDKIFNHGFTTKKNGHGFGLHSSANYMTEMGGEIEVQNQPNGRGAQFILNFQAVESKKK